jgi:plastocyanin
MGNILIPHPRGAHRSSDAHNLQIVGPGGYRSAVNPDIKAHDHYTLTVTLRRTGVYRLICTKPGHVARGMRTAIRVKR